MPSSRVVLFLGGPSSVFWHELAGRFEAEGHRTLKINVSLGEQLFWRRPGAINYRGRFARWKAFLARVIEANGVTDILYYADRQPYHVVAAELASAMGIRAISVENGYLRPDWLTLERGGMGILSHFPADPRRIRAIAAVAPEPDLAVRYTHGFWHEMVREAFYHLITYSWRVLYPFYRSGKYYDPLLEILVGIPHLFRLKALDRAARGVVEDLVTGAPPYFVVALQLNGDHQIRSNSPFKHLADMIETVVASFAAHAPAGARLVFKQHPHDNNWENWSRVVAKASARAGIAERVRLIDGGDLGRLLAHAAGCVMVNSTVGLFSIRAGCPTKILGIAIYDMPGLTHQGPLDGFWQAPEPVDAALAADFVRAIAATIQVKGSFYNPEGRKVAAAEIVRRVAAGLVNEPGGFVDPPPRLETARRLGIAVSA